MTLQEHLRKIKPYGNAHALLVEALKEFPQDMWQFRDEHGCWSIHEHMEYMRENFQVWRAGMAG